MVLLSNVLAGGAQQVTNVDAINVGLLRLKTMLWHFYEVMRPDPEWKKRGSEVAAYTIK